LRKSTLVNCASRAARLRESEGEDRLDEVLTRARQERDVMPVEKAGISRSNRTASSSTGSSTASFAGGMSFADGGLTMRILLRPSSRATTARRSSFGELAVLFPVPRLGLPELALSAAGAVADDVGIHLRVVLLVDDLRSPSPRELRGAAAFLAAQLHARLIPSAPRGQIARVPDT